MLGLFAYLGSLPADLDATDRLTAAILYDLARKETRSARPKMATIARLRGTSVKAARVSVHRLLTLGLWEVTDKGGGDRAATYRLVSPQTPPVHGSPTPPVHGSHNVSRRSPDGSAATSAPGSMRGYSAGIILAAEYNRMAAEAGMPDFNILTATADRLAAEDAAREAYAKAHPDAEPDIPF